MLLRIAIWILVCLGLIHAWHWLTPEKQDWLVKKIIWAMRHDFLSDLQKWQLPQARLVFWVNRGVDLVNHVWSRLPGFLFGVCVLIVIMIVYKLVTKQRIVW